MTQVERGYMRLFLERFVNADPPIILKREIQGDETIRKIREVWAMTEARRRAQLKKDFPVLRPPEEGGLCDEDHFAVCHSKCAVLALYTYLISPLEIIDIFVTKLYVFKYLFSENGLQGLREKLFTAMQLAHFNSKTLIALLSDNGLDLTIQITKKRFGLILR